MTVRTACTVIRLRLHNRHSICINLVYMHSAPSLTADCVYCLFHARERKYLRTTMPPRLANVREAQSKHERENILRLDGLAQKRVHACALAYGLSSHVRAPIAHRRSACGDRGRTIRSKSGRYVVCVLFVGVVEH